MPLKQVIFLAVETLITTTRPAVAENTLGTLGIMKTRNYVQFIRTCRPGKHVYITLLKHFAFCMCQQKCP